MENARICLQKGDWQTGEIYEVDNTDAAGQAQIYVNPATTGTIEVTVRARNYNTYQGAISVTGAGVGDAQSPVPADRLSPVIVLR